MSALPYKAQFLRNAVREHEICTAFLRLRRSGIEPFLLKGWSVARFYPDPVTRRLGDIDLLVRDEHWMTAQQLLGPEHLNIDWHRLSDVRSQFAIDEHVLGRTQLVPLLDNEIRVLRHEDNLRFIAIHMLKHAGWSPTWVEDIAVLLASCPADFNWSLCLGDSPAAADWVLAALVIAHQLTGADLSGTPAETYEIPEWVLRVVRKAQLDPEPENNQPPESIWSALAQPWRIPSAIRKSWANPVTAAIGTGAAFHASSPLIHQLRYSVNLTAGFLGRAVKS